MTFVTKLLDALVWPTAACLLLYWFREDIRALIRRVTKVTTPVGTLETEMREARKEAQTLDTAENFDPATSNESGAEGGSAQEYIDVPTNRELDRLRDRLLTLASIDPNEAVATAWGAFASEAKRIVMEAPSGGSWQDGVSIVANLAMFGLNADALRVVDTLADVRRKSGPFTADTVTEAAALDFIEAMDDVLRHLRSIAIHPSRNPGFLRPRPE